MTISPRESHLQSEPAFSQTSVCHSADTLGQMVCFPAMVFWCKVAGHTSPITWHACTFSWRGIFSSFCDVVWGVALGGAGPHRSLSCCVALRCSVLQCPSCSALQCAALCLVCGDVLHHHVLCLVRIVRQLCIIVFQNPQSQCRIVSGSRRTVYSPEGTSLQCQQ
jgi:hypothetical protein